MKPPERARPLIVSLGCFNAHRSTELDASLIASLEDETNKLIIVSVIATV